MDLREAFERYKQSKIPSFSEIREKATQHSKTSLFIVIILVALLLLALQFIPHLQVAQFNITNPKDLADAENSYRATLAQIFGGVAIAIGIYYTWRRITIAEEDLKATQKNLEIAQEGQITERFTRAVEQLGNSAMEIRLGGIYALERISTESKKDYWPILEILTAYVRKNSSIEIVRTQKVNNLVMDIQANESTKNEAPEVRRVSLDIQAILTVIKRRKNYFNNGELNILNLQATYLEGADLKETHLEGINLTEANLRQADLERAHLEGADLGWVNLEWAFLKNAHLEKSNIREAHLEWAFLRKAHLEGVNLEWTDFGRADLIETNFEGACLKRAHFYGADLERAHLEGADLEGANLRGAENLTVDQLSKVKTLYDAELDPELEIPLREKYPALFEEPKR